MYETGQGLPKDSGKAQFWRTKAEQSKLTAEQAEQREQQQLAQQQQQSRGLQAQQSQLQQHAGAPPANGLSAVERNLQSLARLAAMAGNRGSSDISVRGLSAQISSLQSQMQDARYQCHLTRDKNSACDRWAGLEEDLDVAQSEMREYTEQLCDAQNTLRPQCSAGNQDACRKWDRIKGEVAQRGCFR